MRQQPIVGRLGIARPTRLFDCLCSLEARGDPAGEPFTDLFRSFRFCEYYRRQVQDGNS